MTRLRPQSVGKAESLFVTNLKPFSTASTNSGRSTPIPADFITATAEFNFRYT
jgi:2-oxoglutarate dehydrogenase complex dehydrogenase (E1) component-like enzyme